jgi:hypothetical protein
LWPRCCSPRWVAAGPGFAGHDVPMVKQRARHGDPPLPTATVVIRGELLDPDVLAESAQRNYDVYGFYGISVFAETAGSPWTDLAATRFAAVPWLVLFTAGDLQAAGLELWDIGVAPHYDVVHPELVETSANWGRRRQSSLAPVIAGGVGAPSRCCWRASGRRTPRRRGRRERPPSRCSPCRRPTQPGSRATSSARTTQGPIVAGTANPGSRRRRALDTRPRIESARVASVGDCRAGQPAR